MKKKSLISLFIFILLLSSINCKKEVLPGIIVYKTNGDYFDLATVGFKGGEIVRRSSLTQELSKFNFTNQDTIYKFRVKLINGYILSCESNLSTDVFLDLSFKQYMKLEVAGGRKTLSNDTIMEHILDRNPYKEFYIDNSNPRKFPQLVENADTSLINKLIREGKLEQYFVRLK
jgi:hypothetical protein